MRKYFAYCPEGGFETFRTIEARDAWVKDALELHLDDGWSENVGDICVGEISGQATKCNVQIRPKREEFESEEEFDDAMSDWGGDPIYDSICDYKILPLPGSEGESRG